MRGRIHDDAFVDKAQKIQLQSGDAPPSAFTRVRKYPDNFLPYELHGTQFPMGLLIVSFLGIDYLMEEQMK